MVQVSHTKLTKSARLFGAFSVLVLVLFPFLLPLTSPALSRETYPNVEISGYKKYEYQQISVTPGTNYFLALQQMGVGYGFQSGPWQERLQLRIIGRLSERLSVSYDLEQQPDMPERYQVKVNYDNHELRFGDFDVSFGGNEFASTTKSLNGVLFTSYDSWYNLTLVPSSKIRSYTQALTSQRGNDTVGPYSLGHTSIIEGSEDIELNGATLQRDRDYTIDYFEGKITFKRILTSADEFKYSYEYTNIIDIFFPSVSKRDFFGYRGDFTIDPATFGRPAPKEEPVVRNETEFFPSLVLKPKLVTKEVIMVPAIEVVTTSEGGTEESTVMVNGERVLTVHEIAGLPPAPVRAEIISARISNIIGEISPSLEASATPETYVKLGQIGGEYAAFYGDTVIFTVQNKEAALHGASPEALALSWTNNLNESVRPRTTIEVEEVPLEAGEIPPAFEEEERGTYKLQNAPVVQFSESIIYEGSRLKKDEDYQIDYETGIIKMLIPTKPSLSNRMVISYKYFRTVEESEILPGIGSRGPYDLAHKNIIPGSERVLVSEIPNVRDLDYTINYEDGKILFYYKVLATQNIIVKYRYIEKKLPPQPKVEGPEQKLKIGTTYLKESAKKGEGVPTGFGSDTYTGQEILDENNTVYLKAAPIDESSLVITRNGSALAKGVDWVVPSTEVVGGNVIVTPPARIGFRVPPNYDIRYLNDKDDASDGEQTGTIKILTTVEAGDSIEINYTYYKSVAESYRGEPIKSEPKYVMNLVRNMVPGREQVMLWDSSANAYVIFTPNPSTTEKTSLTGYSINYSYQPYPQLTFNIDFQTEGSQYTNILVNYYYVPGGVSEGSDIAHELIGVDTSYKYGDRLWLDATIAKSQTDKVYGSLSTSETFPGDGGRIYSLHSPYDMVEDSEKVYVNEYLKTKDQDYAISYSGSGKVTFFLDISSSETILIDYDYQDPGVGAIKKKEGTAFKVAGGGKPMDNLEVRGSFRKVGFDFTPMGGISLNLGSDQWNTGFDYKPIDRLSLKGDYKETNDLVTQRYTDRFIRRKEWSLSSDSNVYDMFDLGLGFRQTSSLDDPLPENFGEHTYDDRSDFWNMSINPKSIKHGDIKFTNKNDLSKSLSHTDVEDRIKPSTTTNSFLHTNNRIDFSNWADFTVDYQVNESIILETTREASGSTIEVETKNERARDMTYTTNVDLTGVGQGRIKKLTTMASFNFSDKTDLIAKALSSVRNQSLHVDFIPWTELTTSYHNDRQETPSQYVENLGNPGYERTYSNLRYTGIERTSVYWSGNWDDSRQENGAYSNSSANTYTVDHTPALPGAVLGVELPTKNMTLTTKGSMTESHRFSEPYEGTPSITENKTTSGDINLTYRPISLLTLTSGFNIQTYWNQVDSEQDTDTLNFTYKAGATYKPDPKLDLSGNFYRKETRDNNSGLQLPKEVIDAHAGYKVFTYGTLNYDWQREMNRGEVLSGSVSELDLVKITNSITFTLSIPQNNVVLNNIKFDSKWKQINYEDNKNKANNFTANQLTFEGTLNF